MTVSVCKILFICFVLFVSVDFSLLFYNYGKCTNDLILNFRDYRGFLIILTNKM